LVTVAALVSIASTTSAQTGSPTATPTPTSVEFNVRFAGNSQAIEWDDPGIGQAAIRVTTHGVFINPPVCTPGASYEQSVFDFEEVLPADATYYEFPGDYESLGYPRDINYLVYALDAQDNILAGAGVGLLNEHPCFAVFETPIVTPTVTPAGAGICPEPHVITPGGPCPALTPTAFGLPNTGGAPNKSDGATGLVLIAGFGALVALGAAAIRFGLAKPER